MARIVLRGKGGGCELGPRQMEFAGCEQGPVSYTHLYNFFDLMGLLTDNILLPLGGILMCWFIGWKWKPQLLAWEIEDGCPKFGRVAKVWIGCIRFLVPVMILIVTVTGFMGCLLYTSRCV